MRTALGLAAALAMQSSNDAALDLSFLSGAYDARLLQSVRTSNATMWDSQGRLVWAPANLFLNSATLGTQSVTVVNGATYCVSFYGTGSIALSGGGSGTIAGIDATTRKSSTFTATTTSVTFTVTGSVTSAQLEINGIDSPKAYNATTGSAYYGPRFEYDPVSLLPLGLLVEDQRTNLCIHSQNFSGTNWTLTNTTPTTGQSSPDSLTNATLLTEGVLGTSEATHSAMTIAANNFVIHSRFIKKGSLTDWVCLTVDDATNGFRAWFNLNTGVVGSTASFGTGSSTLSGIRSIGNGWYHCFHVGRVAAASTTVIARSFGTSADNVTTRVNNATRYEFQVDVSANSGTSAQNFMSSPIPTYGVAITRAADTPYMLTSPWLRNSDAALTIYLEQSYPYARVTSGAKAAQCVSISDNTTSNKLSIVNSGGNCPQVNNITGGVSTFAPTSVVVPAVGAVKKSAFAVATTDAALAESGDGTVRTNSAYTPAFATFTHLYVGTGPSGGASCCGHIRKLKIWNGRKSNTQLLQMVA